MIVVMYGILGLIVGSFLNVLTQRMGTGVNLGGRSACDACGKQLRWYHLIPVVSWIVLRGRCGFCGTRLSVQYPLVELLTGGVFAIVGSIGLPLIPLVFALSGFSLLIAISVYDIHHTIIPDGWSYAFGAFALLFSFSLLPPGSSIEWVILLLSGPAIAFPLWALWFVSRGTWMGLGDAKLALGIGWLLGPYWGLMALLGGFIIGAVVSVVILLPLPYMLRTLALHSTYFGALPRGFTMKSEVPFGPFLACSCFLIWYARYALGYIPFGLL